MKKIIFLLLLISTTFSYGQTTLANKLKITGNSISTTATKVNVQESDGTVNTITKSDLIEYLEYASAVNLPVTGLEGKIYLTRDNNTLYRWNGTIYAPITADISGKENISNKQNSLAVDGTGVNYPTVDAVNTGLSSKQNTLINPITGTGEADYLPKFTGSGSLSNSVILEYDGNIGIGNTFPTYKLDVSGDVNVSNDLWVNGKFPLTVRANEGVNIGNGYGLYWYNDVSVPGATAGIGQTTGGLRFFTGSSLAIPKMAVNADGNVGIGTTTPTEKLEVNGNIKAGSATFASNVTVGSNLTLTGENANLKGGTNADRLIVGNSTTTGYMTFNGSAHPTLPNQVSMVGSSLVFTGAATFSSTVTATSFNGSAILTGTPTAPTAAAGTNTTQIATTAFVQANARPYKVYTALLNQSGTSAPTATVLENTLGGTIVWTRTTSGEYKGTLSGAFTNSKTFFPPLSLTLASYILTNVLSANEVTISARNTAGVSNDNLISNATVEIRVYL